MSEDKLVVGADHGVGERFEESKPFRSLSDWEWLETLIDHYEGSPVDLDSVPREPVVQALKAIHSIENPDVGDGSPSSLIAEQKEQAAKARQKLQDALEEA